MHKVRICFVWLLLLLLPVGLWAEEEKWRKQVNSLNEELEELRYEYRRAMERVEEYKKEAAEIQSRDYHRNRRLMTLAQKEESYAQAVRDKAEMRTKRRNRILHDNGQKPPIERNPWQNPS